VLVKRNAENLNTHSASSWQIVLRLVETSGSFGPVADSADIKSFLARVSALSSLAGAFSASLFRRFSAFTVSLSSFLAPSSGAISFASPVSSFSGQQQSRFRETCRFPVVLKPTTSMCISLVACPSAKCVLSAAEQRVADKLWAMVFGEFKRCNRIGLVA
jgi:hypothetical protein